MNAKRMLRTMIGVCLTFAMVFSSISFSFAESDANTGKSETIQVKVKLTMPDQTKKTAVVELEKNNGIQYVDIQQAMEDNDLKWEKNYSISSISTYSPSTPAYVGEKAYFELAKGFNVDTGKISDSATLGDVKLAADKRQRYAVCHYTETVNGGWALNSLDTYTDQDIGTQTGLGPFYGDSYDISPKTISGWQYGYYLPDFQVYWNGLLNSGNFEKFGLARGNAGFQRVTASDLGLAYDRQTGTLSGIVTQMESNFYPYVSYYYRMLRTVKYDANGGDGSMESSNYVGGGTVTVSTSGFSRDGYEFTGWNTSADGTGTAYAAEDTFKMPYVEGLTLYAQWEEEEEPAPTPTPTPRPNDPTPPANPAQPPRVTPTAPGGGGAAGTIVNLANYGVGDTAVIADEASPLATIEDEATPKAADHDYWALLNLLLTIFTVAMGVLLLVLYFTRKGKREQEAEAQNAEEREINRTMKRRLIPRVLSGIWAIAMVIVFFLTEDMSLPMQFTDKWTWLMVIMAIMQLVIAVVCKKQYDEKEEEAEAYQ